MIYGKYYDKIQQKNYEQRSSSRGSVRSLFSVKNNSWQKSAIHLLDILQRNELLTEEHAELIYELSNPKPIELLLELLERVQLMAKPSFKPNLSLYLTEHLLITSKVEAITCILSKIQEKQWHSLLTEEILDLLIMHPDCTSIQELITNNVFTQAQYALLIQCPCPRLIVTELQAYKALPRLAGEHEFPLIDFIVRKGLSGINVKLLAPDDIEQILAKEQPLSIFRSIVLLTRMLDLYNKKARDSEVLIEQAQEYIQVLIMHHDAPSITAALEQVEKTELLASGDVPLLLSKLLAYSEPDVLFNGLYQLRRVQLLSNSHAQDNFRGLIEHPQLRLVVNLLEFLSSKSYLLYNAQKICALLLAHPCPELVSLVCKALDRKDALSIAFLELILQSNDPQKIAAPILVSLYPEQLYLNEDDALALVEHSVAFDAHFLWVCAGAGILTKANIASISTCTKAEEFCYLISLLYDVNFLDDEMAQTNFNALVLPYSEVSQAIADKDIAKLKRYMVQHAAFDAPEKGLFSKFQMFIMQIVDHAEQEIASRRLHLQYVFEYSYTVFLRLNPLQRKKFFDELINPEKTYPILMAFYTWMDDLALSFEDMASYHFEEDFVLIAQHANPILLAEALVLLYKHEVLTGFGAQQYRQLVANHTNPLVVANAFISLSQASSSSVGHVLEDRWYVGCHSEPDEVASTLLEMSKRNLFNESGNPWRKLILIHQHPLSLLSAISDCKQIGFLVGDLGQTVLAALCHYEQPQEISGALRSIAARDSIDHPRFLIMNSLRAYILRIESNKIPGSGDISFEHGFVFFAQYRAKNRRTNYDLAKQLFHTLLFCPTQSISDVFAQVTASHSELLHDKPSAHKRLVASDELNGIFQQVIQLNIQEASSMSNERRL